MLDQSKPILIAEDVKEKLGVIRFDFKGDQKAEINIIIAPEKRGYGLGSIFRGLSNRPRFF